MRKVHDKKDIFERMPVRQALTVMAVPTIISQLVNLIYNMVDAFFIGRTGNPGMMAATTLSFTLVMLHIAIANLFGVGGGSLIARLMGVKKDEDAVKVSAFSFYGAVCAALLYALIIWVFMRPLLLLFGASSETLGYASRYAFYVIVLGSLPAILSLTTGHLLRNSGYAAEASLGLSGGGVLNMALDPLFMFVLMPPGHEVTGAAVATLLSNCASCVYLVSTYARASRSAPLSLRPAAAVSVEGKYIKRIFAVGVPSALLTALFDMANIFVNMLAAAHSDLVLAAMGIVMKVERVPNAINIGICQGMLPIVAYNHSAKNHGRLREVIRTARQAGLIVSALSILLLQILARPVTNAFLSTSGADNAAALATVAFAAAFLRVRCLASPLQFLNYQSSFCMQGMGAGKETLLHAFVRELVFYIPILYLLDRLFGEMGLASALPVGEACGALLATFLLRRVLRRSGERAV